MIKKLVQITAVTALSFSTAHALPAGDQLKISWQIIDNYQDGANSFRSQLVLQNTSDESLPASGWVIYFNFARIIKPNSYPESVVIEHVNRDLHKITPGVKSGELSPGKSLMIPFDASFWAINKTDKPAGFYIVYNNKGKGDQHIDSLSDVDFVTPTKPKQWNRIKGDKWPLATVDWHFTNNARLQLLPKDQLPIAIPEPVEVIKLESNWQPGNAMRILIDLEFTNEAEWLAGQLKEVLGYRPRVELGGKPPTSSDIVLRKDTHLNLVPDNQVLNDDAYHLAITDQGVRIAASSVKGIFYGSQTLLAQFQHNNTGEVSIKIPAMKVKDFPRFAYRGLHLDVARHFQPVAEVKKLIDVMAHYKLNRLHFHLTDDEGWRLAINGLDELTTVGSRRGHSVLEEEQLLPSFGSGPFADVNQGSGYYTENDYLEILQYAKERHIQVIPEIDLPGHARAAIKSMEARYRRLTKQQALEAGKYLLTDLNDISRYQSVQGWKDNVINVCMPSTYEFINKVIKEIKRLYSKADAELSTVHIGGDEVPQGVWQKSPACQKLMETKNIDLPRVEILKQYFIHRLSGIYDKYNLQLAGWEELSFTKLGEDGYGTKRVNPFYPDGKMTPYIWNNVWGWGDEDNAYKLANHQYPVVLGNATNLYFDLAYEKHPAEPGYYWANFTNAESPYQFVPLDLFQSAKKDRMGNIILPSQFEGKERLHKQNTKNILGIQGNLWSENMKTPQQLEYFALPKLLGLAERAWAKKPSWIGEKKINEKLYNSAWNRTANRLGQIELPKLDNIFGGFQYRLPIPGVKLNEDGLVAVNVDLPGTMVRYTLDGSEPMYSSAEYTKPFEATGVVKLRSFSQNGRGGRVVTFSAK